MEEFDFMEYTTLKALSEKIISGLSPAIAKVSKEAEKLASEIMEVESKLQNSTDLREISKLSEISDEKREKIIELIAIKLRLDGLVDRNKSRIAYFDELLKEQGIYQEGYDKKLMASMEEQGGKVISERTLNLNKMLTTPAPKFVFGKLLYFKGKSLDLSIGKNRNVLIEADENLIRSIITMYPQSVATITPEELAHTSFKRKLLKELTYYIGSALKTQSLFKINEQLGEPLCFKSDRVNSLDEYIFELTNSYNVAVKRYLLKRYPEHTEEIETKLVCDESSRFLYEPKITIQEPEPEPVEEVKQPTAEPQESEESEVREEKLAGGGVRKSMVSKELTEAFVDSDKSKSEEEGDSNQLVDVDKEVLELFGIKIDDDEEDE